ncbi:hypothetical protein GCM10011375_19460 [Hymenobacter qilianensis]|uniref:Uncharacterized protein n=1 Tax=Hymenobacter qilianensis TaxID=1385715 RepID=A0ACB5PRF7_9BACT|nr:hypothetical protein GCM10011375_19460 [Hymenobacter qilianensis]
MRATEGGAQLLGKGCYGRAIDKLCFPQHYAYSLAEGRLKGGVLSCQIQHANGCGRHKIGGQWAGE